VLNEFLANISQAIGTQTVEIRASILEKVTPGEVIKGVGVEEVNGKDITFSVAFDQGAVLIDEAGVHAVVKLSEGEKKVLYADALNNKAARPTEADASAFETEYAEYRSQYRTLVAGTLADDLDSVWVRSSALLSKAYVAGLVNNAFDDPDIEARIGLSYQQVQFGGAEIRAEQAPNLNCPANIEKIDCNPTDDCNLNKSCDPGWGCPSCEWYQVDCHARRLGCEADKARYKGQCELEKVTFRTECEARKVIKRAACEVEKAARLKGCEANQAWLVAWQGAHFANLYGNAEFNNIKANLFLDKVAFAEDLSSLSVNTRVRAQSDVVATFDLRPVDAGYFFCQLPFGGQVRFGVVANEQPLLLSASLTSTMLQSGQLELRLESDTQTVKISTSAPPIAAMIEQNPHFVLSCSPLASIVAALGLVDMALNKGVPQNLLKQEFEREIPPQSLVLKIEPVSFTSGKQQITLTPLWLRKAIGFIEGGMPQ
jgi:hypothetical protein